MNNVPSTAAQVLVTIIPIVGIVMGSIVIYFYLRWTHKEKMLLIEKGMYRRIEFDLDSFSLFSGLILTSIGLALLIFFQIKEGFSYSMLSGLVPLPIGISLIIFFILRIKVLHRDNEKRTQ